MPNVARFDFTGKATCNLLELGDPEDDCNILPLNIGNCLPVELTIQPRRSECIKHVLKTIILERASRIALTK